MKEIKLTEQEKKQLDDFKKQIHHDVEKLSEDAINHDLRQVYINMKMLEILMNELNLQKDKLNLNFINKLTN